MLCSLTEPIHRSTCRVIYGDTDAGQVVTMPTTSAISR